MRAIWSGAVSFGLVTVPVKLYPATSRKGLKFNYLHADCGSPVKYQKHCPTCDRDLEAGEIVLGYEYEKDRYVVLTDEELESLPQAQAKTVEILSFVDGAEIDPVYYEHSYYLEPAEIGRRAYRLLLSAMAATGKVALARTAIRSRSTLACVRPAGPALVMHTMYWPDEIHKAEELPGLPLEPQAAAAPHPRELEMAEALINNLGADFHPNAYVDETRAATLELIERKIQGKQVAVRPVAQPAKVIDLVQALEASIAATAGAPGAAVRQVPAAARRAARSSPATSRPGQAARPAAPPEVGGRRPGRPRKA